MSDESDERLNSSSRGEFSTKLSRRKFLQGMAVSTGLLTVAAAEELYRLSQRGVTPRHMLRAAQRIVVSPQSTIKFIEASRGVERGKSDIQFESLTSRAESIDSVLSRVVFGYDTCSQQGERVTSRSDVLLFRTVTNVSLGNEPDTSVCNLPLLRFSELNQLKVSQVQNSGFATPDALGGILFSANQFELINGSESDIRSQISVLEQGRDFMQFPFVFSAANIPASLQDDTYLWSALAQGSQYYGLFSTEVGVRIPISQQVSLIRIAFDLLGDTCKTVGLSSKGSSNGIITPFGELGSPSIMARDVNYLQIKM